MKTSYLLAQLFVISAFIKKTKVAVDSILNHIEENSIDVEEVIK